MPSSSRKDPECRDHPGGQPRLICICCCLEGRLRPRAADHHQQRDADQKNRHLLLMTEPDLIGNQPAEAPSADFPDILDLERMKLPLVYHFEPGAPAVAMADIAFNLVLFFIILARTQDDSNLKWKPASAPKVEANDQSRITVTGEIFKTSAVSSTDKPPK